MRARIIEPRILGAPALEARGGRASGERLDVAFDRRLHSLTLDLPRSANGRFRGGQIGSTSDITSRAVAGRLRAKHLRALRRDEQPWLALALHVRNAKD